MCKKLNHLYNNPKWWKIMLLCWSKLATWIIWSCFGPISKTKSNLHRPSIALSACYISGFQITLHCWIRATHIRRDTFDIAADTGRQYRKFFSQIYAVLRHRFTVCGLLRWKVCPWVPASQVCAVLRILLWGVDGNEGFVVVIKRVVVRGNAGANYSGAGSNNHVGKTH